MGNALGTLYREEHARVLSCVLARVADFTLADESVQDAFAAAQWREKPPPNPRAGRTRCKGQLPDCTRGRSMRRTPTGGKS